MLSIAEVLGDNKGRVIMSNAENTEMIPEDWD